MKSTRTLQAITMLGLISLGLAAGGLAVAAGADPGKSGQPAKVWAKPAIPEAGKLASVGRNPYFVLEPGYQLLLKKAQGPDTLTITVLNETKQVDGVETRVIEERETEGGELIEISRNYFAISKENQDVFYFGEDVDMYKDGKVTGHGGSWLAGVDGAKAGVIMPGKPEAGMRFFQEQAPKVAMDRCEIVSTDETVTTPAGELKHCVKVADDSALEKGEPEIKLYAPGIGLAVEEDFKLAKYGKADAGK